MELLSNYKGWKLSNPKVVRPQSNMEILTFDGEKMDVVKNKKVKIKLLAISNNNTQYEVMIPMDAWRDIR